jgi:hypothetical protein
MKNMLFVTVAALLFCAGAAYAVTQAENDRIQYLIYSVERLEGAMFIRNGSEHSAKDAADHLRMKLQRAGGRVKTADDFIRLCASQSYMSGEEYKIRFSDGSVMKAGDFFRNKLRQYNSGGK